MPKYINLTPDDVEKVMRQNSIKIDDNDVMDAYYALDFSVLNKYAIESFDEEVNIEQREYLLAEVEVQLKELNLI